MRNSILKTLTACLFYSTKELHAGLKAKWCLKANLGSGLETLGDINNIKVISFTL